MAVLLSPRSLIVLLLSFASVAACGQAAQLSPSVYQNPAASTDARVRDLLTRMTPAEKASMLSGSGWMESTPVPRLGIPAIKMADGPMGVRAWYGPSSSPNPAAANFSSTAFPAGILIAASWDPELARAEGQVIGQEVKAFGRDMILGPTVNIQRNALWGRNFESYGEDPYLAGRIATGYIQGVQGEGVIASVKHLAVNDQEYERHRANAVVDERALHEIYTPAFKAAVQQGHVYTVMSAYNRLNGTFCAENAALLKDTLEGELGFRGFVVSDWGSTYSTAPTVNAGMDLEMPGGQRAVTWLAGDSEVITNNQGAFLAAPKVLAAVQSGAISQTTVDENVARILRVIFLSGLYDHPHVATNQVDLPAQRALTRKAAQEGIVLLKNESATLPLSVSAIHRIAVIGPNAAIARVGGGGSGLVHPDHALSPLEAIRQHAGTGLQVTYGQGAATAADDRSNEVADASAKLRAEAVALAAKADVALVFVGYSSDLESEGFDRKSLDLPPGQDELIAAVAQANPHTIVIFNAGDPIRMTRWADQVPAIVDAFYGGEEGGNAIADVIFGAVNPSGKLPFTMLKEWEDSPAHNTYPGNAVLDDFHKEGIYVGYRYFDKNHIAPRYPFGFGLSYTSFAYRDIVATPASSVGQQDSVTFTVTNTGSRAGAEIAQLYIHASAPTVDRPEKELKGFARIELAPGESRKVTLPFDRAALAYWSIQKHAWIADPGAYELEIGSSSRDIRLKAAYTLPGSTTSSASLQ